VTRVTTLRVSPIITQQNNKIYHARQRDAKYKVKAMGISSYHSTIDSAFRTPEESVVPVYLSYGSRG